jgi:hypothetical protein
MRNCQSMLSEMKWDAMTPGYCGAGHMDKAPKKYYITASVGCRYPDPSLGALLGQDGNLFDYISIRFFNDRDCSGSTEVVNYSYSKHWAPLYAPPWFLGPSSSVTHSHLLVYGYSFAANAPAMCLNAQVMLCMELAGSGSPLFFPNYFS